MSEFNEIMQVVTKEVLEGLDHDVSNDAVAGGLATVARIADFMVERGYGTTRDNLLLEWGLPPDMLDVFE